MKQNQYGDLLLNQTQDLLWVVDNDLYLVYANKACQNVMKKITGLEKEMNIPIRLGFTLRNMDILLMNAIDANR